MKKFALLGYPLGHSYSPLIHNKFYELLNIEASYELKEIKEDELEQAILDLKKGIYSGYNVTIPYKIEVMKYLDEVSFEAKLIGSVNTIACIDGKTIGFNTDYLGFKQELLMNNIDVKNKDIYVLGSGGASKAIIKAISDMYGTPIIVSRTKKDNTITYQELENLENIEGIVNTTPVGMYPNIDESPISEDVARQAQFIVDIIFNPSITKLMSYNKNSYNGLAMLIFQALEAERIWFKDLNIDIFELYKRIECDFNE